MASRIEDYALIGDCQTEVRGPRRHFTHSKVMAWVAADRAGAPARTRPEKNGGPPPASRGAGS